MSEILTGSEFVTEWAHSHPQATTCPFCDGDVMRTALVNLAYTFEVCRCDDVFFPHLLEVMWHRECLAFVETAADASCGTL